MEGVATQIWVATHYLRTPALDQRSSTTQCARCTLGCTTKKGFTKDLGKVGTSQTCHTKQIIFTKLSVSKNRPLTNQ